MPAHELTQGEAWNRPADRVALIRGKGAFCAPRKVFYTIGSHFASCLHAGSASALSFIFNGSSGANAPTNPATGTGIISGLSDNLNDQKVGRTLSITSANNTPPGGWPVFSDANYITGDGFYVSGGQVTGVNSLSIIGGTEFFLGNQSGLRPYLRRSDNSFGNDDPSSAPNNSLLFTPIIPATASAPGPLPVMGAAVAFGFSRRLRRKVKISE